MTADAGRRETDLARLIHLELARGSNHRIGLATDNELIWGDYYLYESLHVLADHLPADWV